AEGRIAEFTYDTLDRETRRTHAATLVDQSDRLDESVVYDDALGTRTENDSEGRATVYSFDREGRLVKTVDPTLATNAIAYNAAGDKLSGSNWFDVRTPRHDTTFVYDAAGRLTQRDEPLGRHTVYDYDAAGNLTVETLSDLTDAHFAARVTRRDYDELDRLI